MAEKDLKKEGVEEKEVRKSRITFSSCRLDRVQAVTRMLLENAKPGIKNNEIKLSGPVRLPNKHLRISCRRSPCGEGSKTWDNWEMTVYKRYLDLECTASDMKAITSFQIPNDVEINVEFRKPV